jgi:hypothetical protein
LIYCVLVEPYFILMSMVIPDINNACLIYCRWSHMKRSSINDNNNFLSSYKFCVFVEPHFILISMIKLNIILVLFSCRWSHRKRKCVSARISNHLVEKWPETEDQIQRHLPIMASTNNWDLDHRHS